MSNLVKYQVMIQDGNEVLTIETEAKHARLAYETGLSALGYAPWKFDTQMDLERSNTRRVVYTSKGVGNTQLEGLVKVINQGVK